MRFLSLIFSGVLILAGCHDYDGQTPHGYDYWHHLKGNGPSPNFGDEVFVYFQIRTQDTLLFESPNKKLGMRTVLQDPALNPIKDPDPVADVLPLMSEGDSVTVTMDVTPEMRDAPALQSADKLYYEVVLRKIIPAGEEEDYLNSDAETDAQATGDTTEQPDLRTPLLSTTTGAQVLNRLLEFVNNHGQMATSTSTGVLYSIVENGEESPLNEGEEVKVRYLGCLSDGTVFGENYTSDWFSFHYGAGRVIRGWDEGLKYLRPGGTMLMAVPPALGYGDLGKAPFISPTDTLYYYIELKRAPMSAQ